MFLSAFLAATILPFSSDIVLAALLAFGLDDLLLVILATTGNWLGGVSCYYLGYLGDWNKIMKWTGINEGNIKKTERILDKYGATAALFTWVPIIGDPLAVGLGLAKTSKWRTFFYMLIGRLSRYLLIVYVVAGFWE